MIYLVILIISQLMMKTHLIGIGIGIYSFIIFLFITFIFISTIISNIISIIISIFIFFPKLAFVVIQTFECAGVDLIFILFFYL